MLTVRSLIAAILLGGLLFPPALAAYRPKAVASFSILADLVRHVGGDQIELSMLVGPDSDTHVFEPKPESARALAAADIVFVNGLGFEGWFDRLMEASGYAGKIVTLNPTGIKGADPHAWQDVANVVTYVNTIAEELCKVDAEDCTRFQNNAASYITELKALDGEIKATLEKIPADKRKIITSHDAFGYFAQAYGVSILAPEGISTESEASARDVAHLIRQIRSSGAKALFVENISDPRLIEQIARETGVKVGGTLYTDALSSADGPAATYVDMMRHNATTMAKALGG